MVHLKMGGREQRDDMILSAKTQTLKHMNVTKERMSVNFC